MLNFGGLTNILPKNFLSWQSEFYIIASSKSFNESAAQPSDQIFAASSMPAWFELDTLFMFSFENDNDESEARKKISAKDIMSIEPVQDSSFKGNFHFIIELKQKVYFCGVEYAHEAVQWTDAIRKSKKTIEEISRTKNNKLSRNIDPMVSSFILNNTKAAAVQLASKDLGTVFDGLDVLECDTRLLLNKVSKAVVFFGEVGRPLRRRSMLFKQPDLSTRSSSGFTWRATTYS